ncbi:unnamed protein product [Rangifer tarandus platyrhynchus]|uniref:RIIa domain-containing protein n=1 Tax=Rangifer tarandus platyrhynchus TaxID=3082113 RepID=A0ABN8XMD0_RANTA|nr:unnamed protein product [Rangifer tarandus platyrhynchus]
MPAGREEELSEDFRQQPSAVGLATSFSEGLRGVVTPESSSSNAAPASHRRRADCEEEEGHEGEAANGADRRREAAGRAAVDDDALAADKMTTTLTPAQMLNQHRSRVKLCIENEKSWALSDEIAQGNLRRHHELGDMMELFVNQALQQQPENILKFAGIFFTQPNLRELVEDYSRETVVRPDTRDRLYGL